MRARVYVTLKPSVFDPQGRVIAEALGSLGFDEVTDVRQGKYFEIELSGTDRATASARVAQMADQLLANPVIESYRVEGLDDDLAQSGAAARAASPKGLA